MPKMQIALETKSFTFKVDSIDEAAGIIKGYLAIFNNIDSKDDRVKPGAFKKTIGDGLERKNNRGKKFLWPILWMHDPEKPLGGFIDAKEDKVGLYVTAQFDIRTNEHGIPVNPLAYATFGGYQMGYVDELSVGYKAIQKTYGSDGVRDLLEMQVFEGSAVTMNFAANELAQATEVKSGGGSFPLAPKGTAWSKSKAIKDIEAATGGDWTKAAKYFLWSNGSPKTEADLKFPFVAKVGGEMKAVPRAIFNAAARLSSAKGVDISGVKAKLAHYYEQLGMTPPWDNKSDSKPEGKSFMPEELEVKDFNDYYRQRAIADWASKFYSMTQALKSAVMDAFGVGDQPLQDAMDALNGSDDSPGFIHAFEDWINEGVALDVSDYTKQPDVDSLVPLKYYMSADHGLETKAGAKVSKATAERLKGHAAVLMQTKAMIHNVAEDLSAIMDAPAYGASGSSDGAQAANSGTQSKSKHDRPFHTPVNDEEPPASTLDGEIDLDALAVYVASELGL